MKVRLITGWSPISTRDYLVDSNEASEVTAAFKSSQFEAALELFNKTKDQTDPAALNSIGVMYLMGFGVPQDRSTALKAFVESANDGDRNACFNLGLLHYSDCYKSGGHPDKAAALKWWTRAAEAGLADAQRNIGILHAETCSRAGDVEAVKCYRRAAEQNDLRGTYLLGSMYYEGRGVPQDTLQAMNWWRKGVELECSGLSDKIARDLMALNLGRIYYYGVDIPSDPWEAATWYGKAATWGYRDAEVHLGRMYCFGIGVTQDYAEAAKWWLRAARETLAPGDHGDINAQFYLGLMLADGRGQAQDAAQALGWFAKAASQGHSGAQLRLAVMYDQGDGVPRDAVKAFVWYYIAANGRRRIDRKTGERAHNRCQTIGGSLDATQRAEASNYLGWHFSGGSLKERDYVQGYAWLALAIGCTADAEKRISLQRMRQAALCELTTTQLAAAEKLVLAWEDIFAGEFSQPR